MRFGNEGDRGDLDLLHGVLAYREPPFVLFQGITFFLEGDLVDAVGKTGQLELSLFVGLDAVASARFDIPEQDLDIGQGYFLRIEDLPIKIVLTVLTVHGMELGQKKKGYQNQDAAVNAISHRTLLLDLKALAFFRASFTFSGS